MQTNAPPIHKSPDGGLKTKCIYKSAADSLPLVSIITVVLNGEKHIAQTIQSVIDQTYDNIEYIIIDGGSSDGTLDIIKDFQDHIDYWISEPDNGISDAFNKGIALSTGDYLQLINADDWLSVDQIEIALNAIKKSQCDYVFGDLQFHDENSKCLFLNKGNPDYKSRIFLEMPDINHPSILAKRQMYTEIGGFDFDYKVAMDYEWLLRAHTRGFTGEYVPSLLGHMRRAGISDSNFVGAHREVLRISLKYGYYPPVAYAHFLYRITRGKLRRFLEPLLPLGIRQRLIQKLKRSF